MDSEKQLINQKRYIGEKKKGWFRTGLKVAGGILGTALLGMIGAKMSGNRQNVATNQNLDNNLSSGEYSVDYIHCMLERNH